jgi:hypothetical protein
MPILNKSLTRNSEAFLFLDFRVYYGVIILRLVTIDIDRAERMLQQLFAAPKG